MASNDGGYFDTKLIVPESYESSCLGACVLGLLALGEIEDFSVIEDMVGTNIIMSQIRIRYRFINN